MRLECPGNLYQVASDTPRCRWEHQCLTIANANVGPQGILCNIEHRCWVLLRWIIFGRARSRVHRASHHSRAFSLPPGDRSADRSQRHPRTVREPWWFFGYHSVLSQQVSARIRNSSRSQFRLFEVSLGTFRLHSWPRITVGCLRRSAHVPNAVLLRHPGYR